jgi:hypothetical protein
MQFHADAGAAEDGQAMPWSLTSLRKKLVKIGAKAVSHGQAEVALPSRCSPTFCR